MDELALISENTEKVWTGRAYYQVSRKSYLYRDKINHILLSERITETDVIFFNEISMQTTVDLSYHTFRIDTKQSLFTFLKKGINKLYYFKGIDANDSISKHLIDLKTISLSITYKDKILTFNFCSEREFDKKTIEVIFSLIDEIKQCKTSIIY